MLNTTQQFNFSQMNDFGFVGIFPSPVNTSGRGTSVQASQFY